MSALVDDGLDRLEISDGQSTASAGQCFASAASRFYDVWESSGSGCPNVSSATDRLLEEYVEWSKHCAIPPCGSDNGGGSGSTQDAYGFCSVMAQHAQLPRTQASFGCQAEEQACAWSRRYAHRLAGICTNLLSRMAQHTIKPCDEQMEICTSQLLFLCGSHWDVDNPWCTDTSALRVHELAARLCALRHFDSLPAMLGGAAGSALLRSLGRQLSRESWRDHPQAVEVLLWCASLLPAAALETHLGVMTSLLLRLMDEGEACLDVSVRGAAAMHRLVGAATEAELRRHNRLAVLHEAAQRHAYSRDASFLAVVLPLQATLASMMSANGVVRSSDVGTRVSGGNTMLNRSAISSNGGVSGPQRCLLDRPAAAVSVAGLEWSAMDDFLDHLLFSAGGESRWELRRVYITNVLSAVSVMGLHASRHLRRLNDVVQLYLELPDAADEQCRFAALAILRRLVAVAWPRYSQPSSTIKALLKFCAELSESSPALVRAPAPKCADDAPASWLRFCSGFELLDRNSALLSVSTVAVTGGDGERTLRCYLLLGAVECLAMLVRCSESAARLLAELPGSIQHAGVKHCIQLATSLDESHVS